MKEIIIYSDIGPDIFGDGSSVSAISVKSQLAMIGPSEDILVRINSPGGDVFEGFAIYNLLAEHPGKVSVKIDGVAASAASVIAMAGETIDIAANARIMIHNPYTIMVGDSAEMRKKADLLDSIKESIVSVYAKRAKVSADELSAMMDAETWFDAKGAIAAGLATGISGATAKSVKNSARQWIKNAPSDEIPEFRIAARSRFPIS